MDFGASKEGPVSTVERGGVVRVVLSTPGRFHTFHLARQMQDRGWLERISCGYPWRKVKRDGIPRERVDCYPGWRTAFMMHEALGQPFPKLSNWLEFQSLQKFDMHVRESLRECDVFCALSGGGLMSGIEAKKRGSKYVCDRGCGHIQFQSDILKEEHYRLGYGHFEVDPRIVERESREYQEADMIVVPSQFSRRTFLQYGVPDEKIRVVPYGADNSHFHPVSQPLAGEFQILFVGILTARKGIHYLYEAYEKLTHLNKRLVLCGMISRESRNLVEKMALDPTVTVMGPVDRYRLRRIMSESHVLVLPSIEDGFGMVMAEAMACRCPVIASENTGAADLYTDGEEGFIVPIRDSESLREHLEKLAWDPIMREEMAEKALLRAGSLQGWGEYGEQMAAAFGAVRSQ